MSKKDLGNNSTRMKKYFYVYYSYEPWGRGYIGKRECCCLPEEDVKYFGSFRDKTFKPTEKLILETFDTVREALEAEIVLHDFYEVDKNPHFANRAKATSTGFYYSMSGKDHHGYGKRPSKATIEAAKKRMLSEDNPAKKEEFRIRHSNLMKEKSIFTTDKNPSKNLKRREELSISMKNFLNSLSKEEYRELYKDRIEKTKVMFKGSGNPFYKKTHTKEVKDLLGKLSKEGKWWNNGKINRKCKECPGEGWVNGMYYENHPSKGKALNPEIVEKVRDSNCKYIYIFTSPEGNVIESAYAIDICLQNNLRYGSVVRVARGERNHHKGWKISRRPRTPDDK